MSDHKHQHDQRFWVAFLAQTIHYAMKAKPDHVYDILEHNLAMFKESAGCPATLRKDLK